MANSITEHAYVIRVINWTLDSGASGCTVYVVREAEGTERAVGYSISKIRAGAEVFGDFAAHGAGVYELELAADLNRSVPSLSVVAAKYIEPLMIAGVGAAEETK